MSTDISALYRLTISCLGILLCLLSFGESFHFKVMRFFTYIVACGVFWMRLDLCNVPQVNLVDIFLCLSSDVSARKWFSAPCCSSVAQNESWILRWFARTVASKQHSHIYPSSLFPHVWKSSSSLWITFCQPTITWTSHIYQQVLLQMPTLEEVFSTTSKHTLENCWNTLMTDKTPRRRMLQIYCKCWNNQNELQINIVWVNKKSQRDGEHVRVWLYEDKVWLLCRSSITTL